MIGRKNWMFFVADTGGERAAVMMSFMATCSEHGIDPFTYLRDVIERISAHPMSRLEELLPDKWLEIKYQVAMAA